VKEGFYLSLYGLTPSRIVKQGPCHNWEGMTGMVMSMKASEEEKIGGLWDLG
jgi:hypothetical protein